MDKKIAFEKKLEHLEAALKAYALKLTHDTNDAKDLVQETFMKAIIHSSKFKIGTNLKGWLFTIMYNSFISNYRKAVRTEKYINDKASPIHTQNRGELKFINQDISNAIDRLPSQLRIIFEMNILGYKYYEIAEKFDLPLGTIKTKIYHARKRLKNSLHEYRKTYNLSNL